MIFMRNGYACFWIGLKVAVLGMFHLVTIAEVQVGSDKSFVQQYVRRADVRKALMYTLGVSNGELFQWILKNRSEELFTPQFFDQWGEVSLPEDLHQIACNRNTPEGEIAAILQFALKKARTRDTFWSRARRSYAKIKGADVTWQQLFASIAFPFQFLFLQELVSESSLCDKADEQEAMARHVIWLLSHDFTAGMNDQHISKLFSAARTCRAALGHYVRPTERAPTDGTSGNRSQSTNAQNAQDDLTVLSDPDRHLENILSYHLNGRKRRRLTPNTQHQSGAVIPSLGDNGRHEDSLRYVEMRLTSEREIEQQCRENHLGDDILNLQKEFIYPH